MPHPTDACTGMAAGAKQSGSQETRWNFGSTRHTSLSLDEFLAQKETDGVEFFAGKEPWLKGLSKLNFQTFFRVCTQEMARRACPAACFANSPYQRERGREPELNFPNQGGPGLLALSIDLTRLNISSSMSSGFLLGFDGS